MERPKGQSTATSGGRVEQDRAGLSCAGHEKQGRRYLESFVGNLRSISPSLIVHYYVTLAKWGKNPSPKEPKWKSNLWRIMDYGGSQDSASEGTQRLLFLCFYLKSHIRQKSSEAFEYWVQAQMLVMHIELDWDYKPLDAPRNESAQKRRLC